MAAPLHMLLPEAAVRQTANSSRKAISSAKMPSASVTAKPKIRRPNWPSTAEGLRSAPLRNWPNRCADADAGRAGSDRGETCADIFGCYGIHL